MSLCGKAPAADRPGPGLAITQAPGKASARRALILQDWPDPLTSSSHEKGRHVKGHLGGRVGMGSPDRAGEPRQTSLFAAGDSPRPRNMVAAARNVIAAGREGADRTGRKAGPLNT